MLAALVFALASTQPAGAASSACSFSEADRAWLERSVAAWNLTRRAALGVRGNAPLEAIVFDRNCSLTSGTAMAGGAGVWRASRIVHARIRVGSHEVPVGVISATMGDGGSAYFVMSTPSVWREGKVAPGPLGLDLLMTAVMMHEATHVFQTNTFGSAVERLQTEQHLSDDAFNDDAIQNEFGQNDDFRASVEEETKLFFAASAAPSRKSALRLARQARNLMQSRERKFFVGKDAYQTQAEDLWLTLEGSGQWSGLTWLQLPKKVGGGGINHQLALEAFGKRGKFWSQQLGLAITLTVERLNPPGWKGRLFSDGQKTLLQLLDSSLQAS